MPFRLTRHRASAALLLAAISIVPVHAGELADQSASCSHGTAGNAQDVCCMGCTRAVAIPESKVVEEKKTCRVVKCDQVVVPAITLPWEQGGSPLTLFNCLRHLTASHSGNCPGSQCGGAIGDCAECAGCQECAPPTRCGTVRCVSVLDKDEYEASKCETTWKIGHVPCCGNCGQRPCCCP
jgi:hypothetical protein